MAMLATMQQELERIKAENAMLREALISQNDKEDEGGDNNDGEEETSAAKEAPESHFLTPQRPATRTAESPWTEMVWKQDWSRETEAPLAEPPGYAREPATPARDPWSKSAAPASGAWSESAWSHEPRCKPAEAAPSTRRCDPWFGYWAEASWSASEPPWARGPWAQPEWSSPPWRATSQTWQADSYYGGSADYWQQTSWNYGIVKMSRSQKNTRVTSRNG